MMEFTIQQLQAKLKVIQTHRTRTKETLRILDEQYRNFSDQLQSARFAEYGLCIGDRIAVTDELIAAMPHSSNYHNNYYRRVGCQIVSIDSDNEVHIQGMDISPWGIGGIPIKTVIAARKVYLKNMEAK